ncbi:hypothetical protein D3C75_1011670 [compost metagenome]
MTKVSNVYFGLSILETLSSAWMVTGGSLYTCVCSGTADSSITKDTSTCLPRYSRTVVATSLVYRLSSHSTANVVGAEMTIERSESETTLVALNQVSKLGLLSFVLIMDKICCHISEVWLSTGGHSF